MDSLFRYELYIQDDFIDEATAIMLDKISLIMMDCVILKSLTYDEVERKFVFLLEMNDEVFTRDGIFDETEKITTVDDMFDLFVLLLQYSHFIDLDVFRTENELDYAILTLSTYIIDKLYTDASDKINKNEFLTQIQNKGKINV